MQSDQQWDHFKGNACEAGQCAYRPFQPRRDRLELTAPKPESMPGKFTSTKDRGLVLFNVSKWAEELIW